MASHSSFRSLARFLEVAAIEALDQKKALDAAARIIQKAAKDKIGEYQSQAGQSIAWADLADSTKDDRIRQGYPEDEPGLRDGTMRDSIDRRSNAEMATVGSDDDKMVYFELGTAKQPPRSVLAGAAYENSEKVANAIGRQVFSKLVGKGVFGGEQPIK